MTRNYFNHIKENFSKFEGKEVSFDYYIPSADKYSTCKGYLKSVGTGCNEDCFIIEERGKKFSIYFMNVEIENVVIYEIYQVKPEIPERNHLLFSDYEFVKECGIEITKDKYNLVYTGEMEKVSDDIDFTLEEIFVRLQFNHPDDFKGHSLSVSDIIGVGGKYYYVDSYGFKEIEF